MTPPRLRRRVPRLALSREEAAESLGMSLSHFERHVEPEVRVLYSGAKRLFPVAELQQWVDDHAVAAGGRR